MTQPFDTLETQSPEQREKALFDRLPAHLKDGVAKCPGLASHLDEVDPADVTDRSVLAQLPVLRKPDLMQAQQQRPPFGGFVDESALGAGGVGTRIFMSPGPVWEPQCPGGDPWQVARALYAAGIRAGDRVHNAFSYHMTPGGFIMDEGGRALGCLVFPAGVGNTDAQVEAMRFYQPGVYTGTPDFLKTLLDRAIETGTPLESIQRALVSGGPLFPSMRADYQQRGIAVLQCYATADLGVIAYESEHQGSVTDGMILSENLIVEIVRPGTGDPVATGEVGELVVTNFDPVYPLVRFGTGDMTAVLPGTSDCGRTNTRIKGWMGRADQRTKVRGMFVDPAQIAVLERSQSGIKRCRLVVGRAEDRDVMELQVEGSDVDLAALEASLQQTTKLKGQVTQVNEPLPNDGLVIADERDFENG